jgi:hypothetical protein
MRSVSDNLLLAAAGAATGPADYNGYAVLGLQGGAAGLYLAAFPFSSVSGFGAAIYAPSPSAFVNTSSATFTKDGLAVVGTRSNGIPFAFRWTGSAWGTQYTDPSPTGSSASDSDISPNNNFFCYPESNVFPVVFSWNSATGFGSRVRETTNTVGNCNAVRINRVGTVVVFGSSGSPYIRAFPVTPSSIGAPFSNPSVLPLNSVRGLDFNLTDSVLFAGFTSSSPFIHAYAWSNSTGFGSKYSNPSVLPGSSVLDVAFNPVGGSVAVLHGASPYIRAYPWSDATGFGTAYSNPAAIGSNPNGLNFSPDGKALVAVGALAPRVVAYRWSNISGFGTAYSSPTFTEESVFDVAFSPPP